MSFIKLEYALAAILVFVVSNRNAGLMKLHELCDAFFQPLDDDYRHEQSSPKSVERSSSLSQHSIDPGKAILGTLTIETVCIDQTTIQ